MSICSQISELYKKVTGTEEKYKPANTAPKKSNRRIRHYSNNSQDREIQNPTKVQPNKTSNSVDQYWTNEDIMVYHTKPENKPRSKIKPRYKIKSDLKYVIFLPKRGTNTPTPYHDLLENKKQIIPGTAKPDELLHRTESNVSPELKPKGLQPTESESESDILLFSQDDSDDIEPEPRALAQPTKPTSTWSKLCCAKDKKDSTGTYYKM